jgi:hypothetical protein
MGVGVGGLEMFSFDTQKRVTANKHVVIKVFYLPTDAQ